MDDHNAADISKLGRVIAVQGPVVDVRFASGDFVPAIHDVLETHTCDGEKVVLEVAEHLPDHVARCISLNSTINLQRNVEAKPLGASVEVPVGNETFGRILNVLGEPYDKKPPVEAKRKVAIRQKKETLYVNPDAAGSKFEVLESAIKTSNLLPAASGFT